MAGAVAGAVDPLELPELPEVPPPVPEPVPANCDESPRRALCSPVTCSSMPLNASESVVSAVDVGRTVESGVELEDVVELAAFFDRARRARRTVAPIPPTPSTVSGL